MADEYDQKVAQDLVAMTADVKTLIGKAAAENDGPSAKLFGDAAMACACAFATIVRMLNDGDVDDDGN